MMRKRYWIPILLLAGITAFLIHNKLNVPVAAKGEFSELYSEEFKHLLEEIPHTVIDLDKVAVDTLYPSRIIGYEPDSAERQESSLYLARPNSCVRLSDTLYVCDSWQHAIIVVSPNDGLVRRVGRKGQGPGEFMQPLGIARNTRYVFVYDHANARIQVFDTLFKYSNSISAVAMSHIPIVATDSRLLVHKGLLSTGTSLVDVHQAAPPFRLLHSPIAAIIPRGIQPMAMNFVSYAATERSFIAAYHTLPYIFVFDSSMSHTSTIELRGKTVNKHASANKMVSSTMGPRGGAIQVVTLVGAIGMPAEDRLLIVLIEDRVSNVFEIRRVFGEYRLESRYVLWRPVRNRAGSDHLVKFAHFTFEGNLIYAIETQVLCYDLKARKASS